jgi:predicted ribosome quality control (RQC) complex YloA/Tae2 family protein
MHKNYYLFKTQTNWLKGNILCHSIRECFTYQKSELVLHINNDDTYFLRICVASSQPYILKTKTINIKDSRIHLFDDLIGQSVQDIEIDNNDKIIFIYTELYCLRAVFFGKSPNVFLENSSGREINRFKKENVDIVNSKVTSEFSPLQLSATQLQELVQSNPNENIIKLLAKNISGFNYTLARESCYRSQIDSEIAVSHLVDKQFEKLVYNVNQIGEDLVNPIPCIYYNQNIPVSLSTIEMHHFANIYKVKKFENTNDAWDTFLWQRIKTQSIAKITNQAQTLLNNRIEYLKKTIDNIETFEKLKERKKVAELKGNLILTFIKEIPRGAKSVKLKNIFSEKKEIVEIRLNPAKNPGENAQKYFEKFKDIDIQQLRINNRKSAIQNELDSLRDIKEKYSKISGFKEANKITELLTEYNLLQATDSEKSGHNRFENKFKKIILQNKWEIFIGKNSANNDLLTFEFANKYDWWFHAQGVPGSHTIIHLKNKNEIPPKDIIEQTAALAAFHSTDKHSKSVPVMVTTVRYVRRIKKANPGTVSVLQHKTIFVEPENL